MIVAVDTKLFLSDNPDDRRRIFLYEAITRIVQNNPEHHFIFIFDQPHGTLFVFASNVTPVVTGPVARSLLSMKYWYDVKIPAVLKKYKPDVFVSFSIFCSLATKAPQCLLLPDLSFVHSTPGIKKAQLFFYKNYIPKFLNKASVIVTGSELVKKELLTRYKTESDKVDVIHAAAQQIFKPISDDEKEAVKNKYTGGKEYFLYAGDINHQNNLINLLKAFSIFKKRQKSNLKLIVAGKTDKKYRSFTQSLKTYKYRDDVVLTDAASNDELVNITGAAYAFIYLPLYDVLAVPLLEAMQCGTPVITSAHSVMQEIAKDAALYADAADYNNMAEKMMQLYKDEALRKELIEKSSKMASLYKLDTAAILIWQSIVKACPDLQQAVR